MVVLNNKPIDFSKEEQILQLIKDCKQTFPDFVLENLSLKSPAEKNLTAIHDPKTKQSHKFCQVIEDVDRVGRIIDGKGLELFDVVEDRKVGFLMPNTALFPILLLGLMNAGVKVVMVNPFLTNFQIRRSIESLQIPVFFTVASFVKKLEAVCNSKKWKKQNKHPVKKIVYFNEDVMMGKDCLPSVPNVQFIDGDNLFFGAKPETKTPNLENSSVLEPAFGARENNDEKEPIHDTHPKNESIIVGKEEEITEEVITLVVNTKNKENSSAEVRPKEQQDIVQLEQNDEKLIAEETQTVDDIILINVNPVTVSFFSHRNLIASILQSIYQDSGQKQTNGNKKTVAFLGIPFFKLYVIKELVKHLMIGNTLIFFEDFKKINGIDLFEPNFSEIFHALEYWRVEELHTTPNTLNLINNYYGQQMRKFFNSDFLCSTLRDIVTTGEKLEIDTIKTTKKNFSKKYQKPKARKIQLYVRQVYGCSEAMGLVAMQTEEDSKKRGAGYCGRIALGIEMRIKLSRSLPEGYITGNEFKASKIGIIEIRGPNIASSIQFLNRKSQQMKAAPHIVGKADAWLNTSDLGIFNPDRKQLFVFGKSKGAYNSIKINGAISLNNFEIEENLKILPIVKDCVVVGVPDPILGCKPKGFIILNNRKRFIPQTEEQELEEQPPILRHSYSRLPRKTPQTPSPVEDKLHFSGQPPNNGIETTIENPINKNDEKNLADIEIQNDITSSTRTSIEKEEILIPNDTTASARSSIEKEAILIPNDTTASARSSIEKDGVNAPLNNSYDTDDTDDAGAPMLSTQNRQIYKETLQIIKEEANYDFLTDEFCSVPQNPNMDTKDQEKTKKAQKNSIFDAIPFLKTKKTAKSINSEKNKKIILEGLKEYVSKGLGLDFGIDFEFVKKFPIQKKSKKIDRSALVPKPPNRNGRFSGALFAAINSNFGIDCFVFPYATAGMGLLPAIFAVMFFGFFAAFSQKISADLAIEIGKDNFQETVLYHLGPVMAYTVQVIMTVLTYGNCVAYLVLIYSNLIDIIHLILGSLCDNLLFFLCSRPILLVIIAIMLFPVSYLRDVKFLEVTNVFSVICILYLAVFLSGEFFYFFYRGETVLNTTVQDWGKNEIYFLNNPKSNALSLPLLLLNTPIILGAFANPGIPLPAAAILKHHSPTNTTIIFTLSIIVVCLVYFPFNIFGYFFFGNEVKDNFLVNFPANNYLAVIGRIGALIICASNFFLLHFVGRSNVKTLLFPKAKNSLCLHTAITIAGFIVVLFLAICVDQLSIVLGFMGSIGGTFLIYCVPAILLWKTKTTFVWKATSFLMLSIFVIFSALGVVGNVLSLFGL